METLPDLKEYEVETDVYYVEGFQNSERDSLIARTVQASSGIALSYLNIARALGLPDGDERVDRSFRAIVEHSVGEGTPVVITDGPSTIEYAIGAIGYTPKSLKQES